MDTLGKTADYYARLSTFSLLLIFIESVNMPHIMELLGKTRVVIKDGKVVEVEKPEVEWVLFLPS